ncbi:hypothetical protein QTP88_020164 [Uroleucon formosanum]
MRLLQGSSKNAHLLKPVRSVCRFYACAFKHVDARSKTPTMHVDGSDLAVQMPNNRRVSSDDKNGTATCTSRKKAPALHKYMAALRDMNGIVCLYITTRGRVKRNHSLAEGIMQIFPRNCSEADYTSDVLSPSHAVVVVVVVRPSAIPRGIYPRYSGRSHFGNRGTVDMRVERRLAPSGGDDKSSYG